MYSRYEYFHLLVIVKYIVLRDEPLIEGNSNDSSFQQESEFTQTEVITFLVFEIVIDIRKEIIHYVIMFHFNIN